MDVRRSKDDQGFQADTAYAATEHVVTFRMKRDDASGDRVTFSGTFDGSVEDWDEITKRVDDINGKYEEQRRAGE